VTPNQRRAKDSVVVGELHETGINRVDIEKLCKKWNHLWSISQISDKYILVKRVRKDSALIHFRTNISAAQACELIDRMKLSCTPCGIFNNASTWRLSDDT
jgi:hypothetical protein